MTVASLASEGAAYEAGRLVAALGIPAIGLLCLIIGLVTRSRGRRRPPAYPQYPPSFPAGPGYPYPPPGYPAPPYPAYPGYAPRPRTPKSATTLITIGAVLLAFGIFGNLAVTAARLGKSHRADTSLRVGDCITESDYKAQRFDSTPSRGCADPAATYELAFKGGASDSCPDGKREHSVYDRFTTDTRILCFAVNLKEGQCYLMLSDGEAMTIRLGDCGRSNRVQVRVSRRIDGSTDRTQCATDEKGVGYPVPARVYCLVRAD
ncbi:hypothetical protein A5646_16515 [Mycobacterium sp. 1245499.0]|uniref:LppU/SCO3897 family protein n=1 Tax=unclassified Mycobacterium TaxID=2642494 RepID=UPI0007FBE990|nr:MULTISPECIES: hypothetical protein [unclassified Mycobacterium]OBJ06205.1 hypothetical protein A5624_24390 [Mycobacterium sp. 1482292.6]OBJ22586.1 hypothetical protein A5622_15250 [Mycobacterium sp. 1245801.1]OBL05016.1 hypothetical protein A5646_16515 [Mycobacterium sp. 1245499.0]